jgi:hypothetical protein
MTRFLFRFGYCTPNQWAANEANDWDDESSAAFIIEAEDADSALRHGYDVADAFVASLFVASDREQPMSWRDAKFAAWIEEQPENAFSDEQMKRIPVVRLGEIPNFASWT